MSAIKETLCDNCFDVSSLDEEFFDGMCFPCYKEIESSWFDIDLFCSTEER